MEDTDMTNSERFTQAHKTAKQIRDCFSSYRGAFAFALLDLANALLPVSLDELIIDLTHEPNPC